MSRSLVFIGLGCAVLLAACTLETSPGAPARSSFRQATDEDAGSANSGGPKHDGAAARDDGDACRTDRECASQHCDHEVCCGAGACCRTADDCEAQGGVGMTCTDPATCQGRRGVVGCENNRCLASSGDDDDTACDAKVEADDCGPYKSVFCSGGAKQKAPSCRDSCREDDDCDADAHCDDGCVPDAGDGDACDEDSDCSAGHCANGACCAAGECCQTAGDCPASYSSASQCNDASQCQGTRNDAACDDHVCGSVSVDDDSGCEGQLASECDNYAAVHCSGDTSQTPECGTEGCSSDAECDADAHCDAQCVPDRPDGARCDADAACASGHCQNGFCCESGDCCRTRYDCPFYYDIPSFCSDRDRCRGYRLQAACAASSCWSRPIRDDSGCGACRRER